MPDAAASPAAVVLSCTTGATFRLAARVPRNQAVLEVMDGVGTITHVRVSPDDMRRLAAALLKVAAALESSNTSEEATQPWSLRSS